MLTAFTKVPVYMDNINIVDPLQKDATVEVSATDNVKKGQMAEIKVKVTNIGLDKLENAKLELTVTVKQSRKRTLMGSICYRRRSIRWTTEPLLSTSLTLLT